MTGNKPEGGIRKFKKKTADASESNRLACKYGRCYGCGLKPEGSLEDQKKTCTKNEYDFCTDAGD
jgi:hypothetical protein